MIQIKSPMTGSIQLFLREDGAQVAVGDKILGIESMKMMNEVRTPAAGRLSFKVRLGQVVNRGQVLAEVDDGATNQTNS